MTVLREYYKISHNWSVKRYLGVDIYWDYDHCKLHLPIFSYVPDALTRFQHANPRKPQHQIYQHIKPNHGVKEQYAEAADVSPPLSKSNKNLYRKSQGLFCIMH